MNYIPEQCVFEITLRCSFSCRYCGSRAGKARDNELTTAECLRIADEMAELGVRRVSLIGGEVFMRPDWREITKRLTDHGIRVNIITNGFLFREDLTEDLKALRIESVSVSIDGAREIHDFYRSAGSFDRAVKTVEALAKAGIPVSVISTLNRENIRTLPELYETLRRLPVFAWQLQACSPMGNAKDGDIPYRINMKEVIDFVASHMNDAPFSMGVADNIGYYTDEEGSIRGNRSGQAFFRGCSAGLSSFGIDSLGNVRGCESMYDDRFIEGNLREKSLKEIWEDPDAFAYNRKFTPGLLTGHCAECEMGRYCGGGCRSYNWFTGGKLYESPCCASLQTESGEKYACE